MNKNKQRAHDMFVNQGNTNRVISGLQVDPEGMKRIMGRQDNRKTRAAAVFWIGCNLPRTSHLVLTIEELFDRLEWDIAVIGGPENCCGIVHFRAGDNETGGKIVDNTVHNMERFEPEMVVAWCPTCHLQFNELLRGYLKPDFRFQHVTHFLTDRLDSLKNQWQHRIEKRVALHEHGGVDGVSENIRAIVAAIPGITVVDVPQLSNFGYMCSRLASAPAARADVHRKILEAGHNAGVDIVVTPYHSCQRDLCGAEIEYPFEVKNFITLVGEAMGIEYEDKYKAFRTIGDVDKITEQSRALARQNNLDEEEVREIVTKEFS